MAAVDRRVHHSAILEMNVDGHLGPQAPVLRCYMGDAPPGMTDHALPPNL